MTAGAGLWLLLGGAEAGTVQHRDLGRVAGGGAVAAGVLCLAWAVYTSRSGLWPHLPAWLGGAFEKLHLAPLAGHGGLLGRVEAVIGSGLGRRLWRVRACRCNR